MASYRPSAKRRLNFDGPEFDDDDSTNHFSEQENHAAVTLMELRMRQNEVHRLQRLQIEGLLMCHEVLSDSEEDDFSQVPEMPADFWGAHDPFLLNVHTRYWDEVENDVFYDDVIDMSEADEQGAVAERNPSPDLQYLNDVVDAVVEEAYESEALPMDDFFL